jgi:putative transposase
MGGRKIKGRKRQVLVDTQGFLLGALVHTADRSDRESAAVLLTEHFDLVCQLALVWAD